MTRSVPLKFIVPLLLFVCSSLSSAETWAQDMVSTDSLHTAALHSTMHAATFPDTLKERLHAKTFILPAALFIYGAGSVFSEDLKEVNLALKEEVYMDKLHKTVHIDNYLQFAPAAAVYGLNAMGIKGKHGFGDRTAIYALSNLLVIGSVSTLKAVTHQARPDHSAYTSFPSGHTAEAFASAEFMRQEYRDVSPWYGVAGYAMAITTGYLRMYNNRHWFGDVMAGAGIGIASTDLAYWLYPAIKRRIFPHGRDNTIVMPFYQSGAYGLSMVRRL